MFFTRIINRRNLNHSTITYLNNYYSYNIQKVLRFNICAHIPILVDL